MQHIALNYHLLLLLLLAWSQQGKHGVWLKVPTSSKCYGFCCFVFQWTM
jgi:hypothetical protein